MFVLIDSGNGCTQVLFSETDACKGLLGHQCAQTERPSSLTDARNGLLFNGYMQDIGQICVQPTSWIVGNPSDQCTTGMLGTDEREVG